MQNIETISSDAEGNIHSSTKATQWSRDQFNEIVDNIDVHMSDPERVTQIIQRMTEGGNGSLQVIADFDFTLTAFTYRGEKCVSCHKAFDDSPRLPKEYRHKANSLRNHYYAIEIDPYLSMSEKYPKMVEWWTQSHNLLVEYMGDTLNQPLIQNVVQESKLLLREGCNAMFKKLHQSEVPLLIFSAGIGDVIQTAIDHQSTMYENIKIVSNFIDFNEQGYIQGFKGDLIHSLNKCESSVSNDSCFKDLSHRPNVVLMGDNLGDLRMSEGAHIDNILTIGFLNDKITERLNDYKAKYDIVLVADETMDIPNAILDAILK